MVLIATSVPNTVTAAALYPISLRPSSEPAVKGNQRLRVTANPTALGPITTRMLVPAGVHAHSIWRSGTPDGSAASTYSHTLQAATGGRLPGKVDIDRRSKD